MHRFWWHMIITQLLWHFHKSLENHLECINITGCVNFIQNEVASHQLSWLMPSMSLLWYILGYVIEFNKF